MKKDIKVVSFDIDGTLMNSKGEVLEESIKLVKDLKKAGYKVVLCTGRPFNGYWWIREGLELMGDDDLSISATGAHIRQNATGKGLVNRVLDKKDVEKIKSYLDDDRIEFTIYARDYIYNNTDKPSQAFMNDKGFNRMGWLKYDSLDDIGNDLTRVCFVGEPEVLKAFEKRHQIDLEKDYTYVRNDPRIGEVLNKEAGKSEAMITLCEMLDISPENVMYFGDGANDAKTIKLVGVGVAMGNARTACKENADYIIGTNDEPSIANFVRKYLDLDE